LSTVAQAGHLVIVWEPNHEPDVAGYIVHYGTRPGTYEASLDVGAKTRVLVGPLADSVRYYFAVSAYDRWNNESALSREVSGVVGQGEILPTEFVLYPSFPNPFATDTWLAFDLPSSEEVELRIFDINGKLVRTLRPAATNPGANAPVLWDGLDDSGRPVPSGIYYCRGFASTFRSQTIRIIRLR
jgi:hypothetical protein